MLHIKENYSLSQLNTFRIDVSARYFIEIHTISEMKELLLQPLYKENECMILGGGSNILFRNDYEGLIIHNLIKGREICLEKGKEVVIQAGAGEVWHDLVRWTVSMDLYGLENLSLIPGSMGAAPIQNIGAYGAELQDVFFELDAMHLTSGKLVTFNREECDFGYRYSIFKGPLKGKYFIYRVRLLLSRLAKYNLSYGALKEKLAVTNTGDLSLEKLSDIICEIRRSKLPDPSIVGNAGSFFKNPEIPQAAYNKIKEQFPDIPAYPGTAAKVKVPAAWLIDKCGWKGIRKGGAGSYPKQALVLVNYGDAKGEDIWKLAVEIQESVLDKFGIKLSPEVNII